MKTTLLLLVFMCTIFSIQAQNQAEQIAENWLDQHLSINKLESNSEFKLYHKHVGPAGETIRFRQEINGIPVLGAEIAIHVSPNNKVTYHSSTIDTEVRTINTVPTINPQSAMDIAKRRLNTTGTISFEKQSLMVFNNKGNTQLVHKIILEPQGEPHGSWEILVDAENGQIIQFEDKAVYHSAGECDHGDDHEKGKKKNKKNVTETASVSATGSGYVFDPDPLSAAGVSYGGQYVDGNDATNASLDAARSNVTLLDITFSGGMYSLVGPYAEVQDFENPNRGLFEQASSAFNFNRQQNGFEAVNVYYHVDHSMRYINETLGITLTPLVYSSGVRFDPHGLNGSDNSYYLGGSNRIAFGEGCVDDAEDADVVIHELGHGIHDWITGGNLSQVNGLSEGCGDYWAQSYSRSLGQWTNADPQYNYMFDWDGHNTCWGGRITNYTAIYPGGLVNQVHTDGQMWASVLMEIYDLIGRTKTDAAFLEGLAMTGGSTNQQDAAIAVRQAAVDMVINNRFGFTCNDVDQIEARFAARGYSLPAVDCEALSIDENELDTIAIYPNPTRSEVYFSGLSTSHHISIYNMLGQQLGQYEIDPQNNLVDLSSLSNGVYFIKFTNLDASFKIIKE